MNVLQLLIAAIVAVTLLYLITTLFVPLFTVETKLGTLTEGLLNEAQADLGQAKGTELTLKQGQSLYARNLDNLTRTVSFACASADCCPLTEKCSQPLSATGERLIVNQSVQASITARCEEVNQIHACKVYVGKEPAQVIIENVSVQENVILNGTQELPISVTIRNGGENPASNVTVRAEWLEEQTVSGVLVPTVVQQDEKSIESIPGKKNQSVNLALTLNKVGTFTLRLRAFAADGGTDKREYTIHVTGTEIDLCARDQTKNEAATYDAFEQVCRKKVFCTGCSYTYQCREIWEFEAPISGVAGAGYDPTRGEPGFAYQIWDSTGTC